MIVLGFALLTRRGLKPQIVLVFPGRPDPLEKERADSGAQTPITAAAHKRENWKRTGTDEVREAEALGGLTGR